MINLQSGFFCPETTKWVANYTVTTPTGLNGRQTPTELYVGHTTASAGQTLDASLEAGTASLLTVTSGELADTQRKQRQREKRQYCRGRCH